MMPGISDAPLVGTDTGSYPGGSLDTQTVTTGSSGSFVQENVRRGFVLSSLGAISDGTSNLYSGAAIRELYAFLDGGSFDVAFTVTGVVANSGWNALNVGGSFVLSRAAATFSTFGGNSSWTWAGVGNPFGVAGQTRAVGFD